MGFYSYLWLRCDGSPYYAGKGFGNRAFVRHKRLYPPVDKSRILVFPMLSEAEAFESETALIDLFGRRDLGTGCLHNFTNGGEGLVGLRHADAAKRRMSVAKKGKPGHAQSDATKRALRESHLGRQITWRDKISATLTGRKLYEMTPEIKAKMSASHLARRDKTAARVTAWWAQKKLANKRG